MKKHYVVLLAGVVLILVFVLGGYFYKSRQAKNIAFMASENASTFVRDHSPTAGSDDAKVYIVEFMDPACETCSAFHPYIKGFLAAHPGRIKLVIRYAPFHDNADYFVKILEASRKQGKYWETMEVMFRSQGSCINLNLTGRAITIPSLNWYGNSFPWQGSIWTSSQRT